MVNLTTKLTSKLKRYSGIIKKVIKQLSITEYLVLLILCVGLPSIGYIYVDIRLAYTILIFSLLGLSILKLRQG